jgi:hypothetical protein
MSGELSEYECEVCSKQFWKRVVQIQFYDTVLSGGYNDPNFCSKKCAEKWLLENVEYVSLRIMPDGMMY